MSSKLHQSLFTRVLALVAVLALFVVACAGDSDSGDAAATTAAPGVAAGEPGGEAPRDGAGDGGGDETDEDVALADPLGTGGVQPIVQPIDFARDIIYTADLTVAVTDVAAAGREASRIIDGFGGILFGQQTEGLPEPRSVLVFKVLPGDFQAALDALGSIGEVRTQNVSADDVTERVVDLQSRITTLETSVERLRGFLENASAIEDIAEIEAQLVEREQTLETLRGQLRTLRDRVALATITVTLTEALANPSVRLLASAYAGEDGGAACPGSENVTVERGDSVNLCFEIRNNGDTTLTDFTLEDTVLGLMLDDLIVIDGDPTGDLQPGQSLILAAEVEVERRIRTQTTVTAVPVNQDGSPIETRKVSSVGNVAIRAEEPEGLPGFDDGVRVATDVLKWIGGVIVIFAGLAVPFLWLIPLIGLWWWWRRRREEQHDDELVAILDGGDAKPPARDDAAVGHDASVDEDDVGADG